jgi:putative transposase
MALFKNTFRIESTRLKEYDYSRPGGYFVTICTHNHDRLFGDVQEEEMKLSPIGEIARKCWEDIPKHFNNIDLDAFVIMPNHLHGIIMISDKDDDMNLTKRRDVQLNVSTGTLPNQINVSTGISSKRGTLSVVIRTFKAAVTTVCRRNGYEKFRWQSRFYEHVLRDERDLQNTRDYIINNPIKWSYDEENRE